METTTLRVRVSSPNSLPVPGATVRATLREVGVSLTDGYVDLTEVTATAGDDGVAELVLWPSAEGATGAEYRIVARSADGRRLIDESVTVPISSTPVWLHDIVMIPPPTPKPYDEAAIEAIRQNRILAQDARDNAESIAQEVGQALDQANSVASQATDARDEARHEREAAQQARDETDILHIQAEQAAEQASDHHTAIEQLAGQASDSASAAELHRDEIVNLYGSAEALSDAVQLAEHAAGEALSSKNSAEQASALASSSATRAADDAQLAQSMRGQTSGFATEARQARDEVANDRQAVADELRAVESLAEQVEQQHAEATTFRDQSEAAASTSLDRASSLISHGNNILHTMTLERSASEQAISRALDLYGGADAIHEAVQHTYANRVIVNAALTNNLIILRG